MLSGRKALVNWVVIAVFAAVAVALGVVPAAFLVQRPDVAAYFGGGVGLLALLGPRKLTRILKSTEYFFEFMEMLGYAALLGLCWMALYGAFSGIGHLTHWFSNVAWLKDSNLVAFRVSLTISASLGFFLSLGVWDDIRLRMALPSEGGLLRYPELSKPGKGELLVTLVPFALLIVLRGFKWPPGAFIFAQIALFAFSAQFRIRPPGPQISAAEAIARLYKACGYSVTVQPRIGDESIDVFLKSIDVFAEGEFSSFAIRVLDREGESNSADWGVASSLRAAASLYAREPEKVRCIVLLLGVRADPSVKQFGENERVQILEFPDEEIARRAGSTEDPEALQKLAAEYLHLQPELKGAAAQP